MDQLPFELYSFIFDHLCLVDLIKLRSVSKKFKYLIDKEQLTKDLYIGDDQLDANLYQSSFLRWFYNAKSVKYSIKMNLNDLKDLSTFKKQLVYSSICFNLKVLLLKFSVSEKNRNIFSHYIAKFIKLEHLEIINLNPYFNSIAIRHQNIKTLIYGYNCEESPRFNYHPPGRFSIDCPNLETTNCVSRNEHLKIDYSKLKNCYQVCFLNTFRKIFILLSNLESVDFLAVDNFDALLNGVIKLGSLTKIRFQSTFIPLKEVNDFSFKLKKQSKNGIALYYDDKKVD